MARKRLNKKVALVGSAVFVLAVLAAIAFVLHLSRDPEKFISDGDAALKEARQQTDEEAKTEKYKLAERSYHKARALAKTDSLKVEMLFKLADLYLETDRWRNAIGCWNEITRIDPKNIKARLARLKYLYTMADSYAATGGGGGFWQEVESQASEFMEIAKDANLLAEDTAKWESFHIKQSQPMPSQIGPYLYFLRGRAVFEISRLGAVTNPEDSLSKAISDLEKTLEFEKTNPQVYWYLAQAYLTRGDIFASRGSLEEKNAAKKQAKQLLEQAVASAERNVNAYTNLLAFKLGQIESGATTMQEQIQSFEPECLSLVEKFSSEPEAYSTLAGFYVRFYVLLGPKSLDKAVNAIEKASELDPENVNYIRAAANLHYRKFSVYGQNQFLYKAIEISKHALTLPEAQDKPGPQSIINKSNRVSLFSFLADCYIEQVLEPCEARTETETKQWLMQAEQAVHEIEQLIGSGEDPQVIRWQGMLELARGNRPLAVRKLYSAYEQLTAAGGRNVSLSYTLAKLFENTAELGAANEFFTTSDLGRPGGIDERKPVALLDYADVLLKLKSFRAVSNIVSFFEERYQSNKRSQVLQIKALIGAGQFDEAEKKLGEKQQDDLDTIKLRLALAEAKIDQLQRYMEQKKMRETVTAIFRPSADAEKETLEPQLAELKNYASVRTQLVEKLLAAEPCSVDEAALSAACENYIAAGEIEQAKNLINRFLEYRPENTTAFLYQRIVSEPNPNTISGQKRNEVEEKVLSSIAAADTRAMSLGLFYLKNNEPNRAAVEFQKVLRMEVLPEEPVTEKNFYEDEESKAPRHLAANHLADMALRMKNSKLAEEVAGIAQRDNLDGCQGRFFAAVADFTRQEYDNALANLDECLKQKPVFSLALSLRSRTYAAIGNEHASIKDAQNATSSNPLDAAIAKQLWTLLYQRNQKLGDNVSSNQEIETRAAINRAVSLNPDDLELLSDYAEYILSKEPLRALAIRQKLQRTAPNVQNSVLLGKMATRIAVGVKNPERKKALFDIAQSSFEQARKMDPQSGEMLFNYSEYYRVREDEKQAEQLLLEAKNPNLLWSYYYRTGRLEDAKKILQPALQVQPKPPTSRP